MANISTTYMGLHLSSPIIVGSSGLTNKVENIKIFEKLGAGAVVLKSLFEEQIRLQISHELKQETSNYNYPEAFDYISNYSRDKEVSTYLELIKSLVNAVKIPIIASVNCTSSDEWITYAREIELAGANALELNIFVLPSDPNTDSTKNENIYFNVLQQVTKHVKIPVSVKISSYFSALAKTAIDLSNTGIKGLVVFNRFYSPDIDINTMEVIPSNIFSNPEEISHSLRWVAMLSNRLGCDMCASTGIHDGSGVIKQLLAGAKAVQVVSTLYKNGFERITSMNNELRNWMITNDFTSTNQFIGKLSFKNSNNPAAFERVQFMKYFAGIE
ncbi:MAG: dihydroorotate dehydrogenase-like protein [Omnitrophica WOR_2 bacterium]|jgi:dihydroorotate dehydrogenase (fumarate)